MIGREEGDMVRRMIGKEEGDMVRGMIGKEEGDMDTTTETIIVIYFMLEIGAETTITT